MISDTERMTFTMLRKILCGTLAAMALATAPCAAIPRSEIALGGIPLLKKYSVEDVKRMYGPPTKESYGIMEYGDSVRVLSDEGMISCIEVTDDNGWKTPSGIHVGMTQDEILDAYGPPDDSARKGRKTLHVYMDDEQRCVLGVLYDKTDTAFMVTVRTSLMAAWEEWYPSWKRHTME